MKFDTKYIRNRIAKIRLESVKYSSEAFYTHFENALSGTLAPEIHVVPSEPGSGKSLGVQKYLKTFRDRGFTPSGSSVLVILSRREEIRSYIAGAELIGNDFAVLDSRPPLERVADYGGMIRPSDAPILFTTTQLLMSRCGPSFTGFEALFYKGKPRSLRICDEEFRIALPVSISTDDMGSLKGVLRSGHGALAELIDDLHDHLRGLKDGDPLTVAATIGPLAKRALSSLSLSECNRESLEALASIAGRIAHRSEFMPSVPCLAAEAKRLPADIAPLFVFDASARVDSTYEIMKKAGLPIRPHAALASSYASATFHHLRMGAGRITLRAAANRQRVVLEAAEVINKSANQPWIVLYNDLKTIDIAGELATACAKPGNLHFVKWGDHRANNDLRHIKRVMCLGLYRLPTVGYDQAHIAASGAPMDRVVDRQGVRDSALRSSMLQGFARSNMRNHEFGECGACEVYVIDNEVALADRLAETFPDCKVVPWAPSAPKLSKQQARIFGYVRAVPRVELAAGVKRAEIYRALSIDKSNFAKQITPQLRAALAVDGVLVDKFRFYIDPA